MRLSGWKPASGGDRNMQNRRDQHNQIKLHITLIIHSILLLFRIYDGNFNQTPEPVAISNLTFVLISQKLVNDNI